MHTKRRHIVGLAAAGLALAAFSLLLLPTASSAGENNRPVALPDDVPPASVAANGFITGVVTSDDGGASVAYVEVYAYDLSLSTSGYDYTDASGVYSISVPAGSYRVEFYPSSDHHVPEYYDDVSYDNPGGYTPVAVGDDAVTPNINAGLAAGAQVSGRVTNEGLNPLNGIAVEIYALTGSYYAYGYTGADGVYTTTPGLPPGDYRVAFADYGGVYATEYYTNVYRPGLATTINLTTAKRSGIDAALTDAAVITGLVTGPGPLEGIRVYAYYADENRSPDSVTTDVTGAYRLAGLGPIGYKLRFYDNSGEYLSEWHQDEADWATANTVTLSSGVTTTINAELTKGAIITGTVTDESDGPLANIDVNLYDASTGSYAGGDYSDASGVYRIGGLAAASYKIRFRDLNGVYINEYYDDKPDFDSADPVTLTAGTTTTIDAQLTQGAVITGVVTNEGGSLLLEDIAVTVYDASTGGWIASDDTDSSGVYHIGGLAAGGYKLLFEDYDGVYLREYYDDKPDFNTADPVTVTAGTTTTIDVQLTQAAIITGVVTDESDGPLTNIDVDIYDASTGSYAGGDYSDASGVYLIGGLAAGSYKIRFCDPNGVYMIEYHDDKPDFDNADPVTVTAGTTTINAQLTQGAIITGVVTNEGGSLLLEDIAVTVYDVSTGGWVASDDTGGSGVYHIGGLAAGGYKLSFDDYDGVYLREYYDDKPDFNTADPVTVTAGTTTTIDVQLTQAAIITGVVTDESDGPLANIDVNLYDASTGSYLRDDDTDASGVYRFDGLAAGSYKLYFRDYSGVYINEYHDDKPDLNSADPVTVTAGTTTTIDAQLTQAAIITGVVTDESDGPLANIDVNLYDASTGSYLNDDDTDASGVYRIGGLAAGSYKIHFRDPNGVYMTEYHDDKPDLNSADPLTVTAGTTTTVNAQLTQGAVITGVVTDESDGPLANIDVNLYDASTGSYLGDDDTDASGVYRIGGLATGSYKLYFRDYSGVYINEYHNDKPDLNSADPVTVTAGTTATVNAQLAKGGAVTGTITDESDGPLANIDVNLYDASTGSYLSDDDTDASGVYRIGGLATGSYKLYFRDYSGDHLNEYYDDKPNLNSADPISVTAGMTTTANAAMSRGGRITGRVTAAASGLGVAGVSVRAERQDRDTPDGTATTNVNGYYTTTALYTGVYLVKFSPPKPYYSEYYDNFCWGNDFTPVTVTAPLTTTGVNAALQKGYLITGTVTGSGPLESVHVTAYRGGSSSSSAYAYSNSSGAYQLGPLDPSDYRVYFKSPDVHGSEWYSDAGGPAGATVIEMSGDVGNINAALGPGGRISGTVTGEGGEPLANLWVYVYPARHTSSVASDRTDVDGHYISSPGLPTGQYQIKFSAPAGYTTEWYNNYASQSAATVVSVTAGVTVTNVNARLAARTGGTITGIMTAADTGLGVSGSVYAYNSKGSSARSDYTSDGEYVLDYLPPDVYLIYFSPNSPYTPIYYDDQPDLNSGDLITMTADETIPNVNQAVPLGGVITGTVTDTLTGSGIPGVYVYAKRVVGDWATKSTYTGVDGGYRMEGLRGGGYKVQFSPSPPYVGEWHGDTRSESAAQVVSVTLGATTPDVGAGLAAGGVITGLITASDTGEPLPGAYVSVYSETGAYVASSIYADRDGVYQTPGLPAGDYRLYFDEGPWSFYRTEWYDNARSQSNGVTVTVPLSGALPNVNAVLDRGGSISGWTYSGMTGLPMNNVYVAVYSATTYSYTSSDYGNNWGLYQVGGLPAGLYKVYFSRSGYETQWFSQAVDFASALTVTVSVPDDTPNINAYLRYPYDVYLPLVLRDGP